MGIFDFLDSEKSKQKKIWNEINRGKKYVNLLKSMYLFENTQRIMLFSLDMKNLTSNEYEKIIAYFGGVADYVSQNNNFSEEESLKFIAFYLCTIIFDDDYTKILKVLEEFVDINNSQKLIDVQKKGVKAFIDTINSKDGNELGFISTSENGLYSVLNN